MRSSSTTRRPSVLGTALAVRRHGVRSDTGAAMVEFALVLPLLLLLVVGMIRFGVAFNTKIEMSGAAREAARWMVLHPTDQAGARSVAQTAAPTLGLTNGEIAISSNCSLGSSVTVTITRAVPMDIPFGPTAALSVSGTGNMQC